MLLALAVITPLALLLSDFAFRRQRQAQAFQQNLSGQAAVRGGLDVAVARLQSGEIALGPVSADARFDLELRPRAVHVRVSRDADAVLGLDGRVIAPEDVGDLEVDKLGIDPVHGAVHEYRRLEVYRVEAECRDRYPFAAVRLLAVVARLDGEVLTLGVRYDRGYFP
ncbi:MAG TPA: hypothetical protein VGQ33_02480 [Vicinamibacteria bacterium]|nr:hypothetical protein [Vicinamibacteria bacterium]